MNLHGIVSGAIGVINPKITASIQISTGYTQDESYNQIPVYSAPQDVQVQRQPLSTDDLKQLDGLNVQGEKAAFYSESQLGAVQRIDEKGGDVINLPDGTIWLVVMVLEKWPDWVKVACVRQKS